MRAIGQYPTEAELYDMISEVDQSSEGEIDFQQFCSLMLRRLEELNSDEYLRQAFRIFDRDLDGFITTAELRAIIYNLGEHISEEEFAVMMQEIDYDNDGVISYADFVKAMRN
uniref:GK19415 n=1 Tax=Drosophila willistoni TaxID=7260 RepID=B4MR08_DROWI